ncbi:MAG: DUF2157 domain-containing protein [Burkholderiaceae bacterium]|jgi:uncharacterized membrane protein|nr:DUF2157 domain-containing protein [Burkholderiaceae bacterium]
MPWTQKQAAMLMRLAEAGALPAQALQAAAGRGGPLQPAPADWRRMADGVLALAGALLLAAGVIFFFAYNWADLQRFAKLGLAFAALTASVAAAAFCAPGGTGWRAALFAAMLCCGALLALIGQSYQTGADVWELFAAWAALALPLALLARSSACWALWLVIGNSALNLIMSNAPWLLWNAPWLLWSEGSMRKLLFLTAACNLLFLALAEWTYPRWLAAPRRHVQRLAALAGVLPLTAGACAGWWPRSDFDGMLSVFFVCVAALLLLYYRWRRDVVMLAIACYASVAVLTAGFMHMFEPSADAVVFFLMLALFVTVFSGAAGVWLIRVHRQSGQEEKAARHG